MNNVYTVECSFRAKKDRLYDALRAGEVKHGEEFDKRLAAIHAEREAAYFDMKSVASIFPTSGSNRIVTVDLSNVEVRMLTSIFPTSGSCDV